MEKTYMDVADLDVYQKLCKLHIIDQSVYSAYGGRHRECIRMLNGLEKSLEKQLPQSQRRWGPPDH